MNVIVPLAGPDYCTENSIKGLVPSPNEPLLLKSLKSRPWCDSPDIHYTFILLDNSVSRWFFSHHILNWFPNAYSVFLSSTTQGAALSVAAGISLSRITVDEPIVVDLADFTFTCQNNFSLRCLSEAAYAFTFFSENLNYSYFRCDSNNKILKAAEKKVISSRASVGVYFFQSSAIYLSLVSMALSNPSGLVFNDLLYISPLFNLLRRHNLPNSDGYLIDVFNVVDLSQQYYV